MSLTQILLGGPLGLSLALHPGGCQPCGKGVLVAQACSWSTSSSCWSSLRCLERTICGCGSHHKLREVLHSLEGKLLINCVLELYFRLGLIRVPNKVFSISLVVRWSCGSSLLLIHSKFFLVILEVSLEDPAVEAKPNPDWSSTFWSNQVRVRLSFGDVFQAYLSTEQVSIEVPSQLVHSSHILIGCHQLWSCTSG